MSKKRSNGDGCQYSESAAVETNPRYGVLSERCWEISNDGDPRSDFFRDYTRIIHSRSFRRLRNKTQVFIFPRNDHICTRLEHSLYVASISKTICDKLGLNSELAIAIAIGHDLGHAPFGHHGEECINKVLKAHHSKWTFRHEAHSLRLVDELESPYFEDTGNRGMNLTFAVRDGIACHCGEQPINALMPELDKTPAMLNEMVKSGGTLGSPATLEGCVVRIADVISYIGRDIEDASLIDMKRNDRTRIVDRIEEDVKAALGSDGRLTNRSIINSLTNDIVKHGVDDKRIRLSDDKFFALEKLKKFNEENIYKAPEVQDSFPSIERGFLILIPAICDEIDNIRKGGLEYAEKSHHETVRILDAFLNEDVGDNWQDKNTLDLAVWYVAGMTDNFFIESVRELFLPRRVY